MGTSPFSDRIAIASTVGGLLFAVFCFEGYAMTLALEVSMSERKAFPKLLGKVLASITFTCCLDFVVIWLMEMKLRISSRLTSQIIVLPLIAVQVKTMQV